MFEFELDGSQFANIKVVGVGEAATMLSTA